MRFHGVFFVMLAILLLGIVLMISSILLFPIRSKFIQLITLIIGIGLFSIGFHELCHLVGLLMTHNQDMVTGLGFLRRGDRLGFGIETVDEVPREDASLVYLSSFLTVPATFLFAFCGFLIFWLNFLPCKFAVEGSIILSIETMPFTILMSYTYDFQKWKELRGIKKSRTLLA